MALTLKKPGFGMQCLLALVFGAMFGKLAPATLVSHIKPIGDAFLQLLQMVIIPVTFVLVVTSFTRVENMTRLRQLGFKTLFWFLFTAVIAAIIGLTSALLLRPGVGFPQTMPLTTLRDAPVLSKVFLDMLPGNLIDQMAHGKVIPIIVFGILFAIAMALGGQETKPVKKLFDGLAKIFMQMTRWIIRLSPIGIFVFIADVTCRYGFKNLLPFGKFILAVYAACFAQLIVYGLLLFFFGKKNPFVFVKKAWPALLTAFTTSSSLGTLPVTLETLIKRMGISKSVASFVAPLGANAKMDGCGAIYPAIVCIFTATLFHIPLGLHEYIMIILTAAIATIGTAGVPGSASVMSMVVLTALGLPFTALAMVMGMDKVIDMMRTTVNVAGTLVTTTLIAGETDVADRQIQSTAKEKNKKIHLVYQDVVFEEK